jgi:Tol biopolymer transport system component
MLAHVRPLFAIAVLTTTVIAFNGSPPTEAAHPGDNGRIAFALQDGETRHIWTMEPDGTDRQQITTGAVMDFAPRYSPDGMRIAFRRNTPNGGIFTVDADGQNLHFVPATDNGYGPTWSPDGTRITFGDQTTADIFTVGINGDDPTNLTNSDNADEFSPDWSPNGERIAFIRRSQLDGSELWTMDTAGLNRQKLTTSPDLREDVPDWSPDGAQIVFEVYDPASSESDIAVINSTGGEVIPLAATPAEEDWPVFSPDSEQIAYNLRGELATQGADPLGRSIVVMNADGTGGHSITLTDPALDETPDWAIVPGSGPEFQLWGDNDCSGTIDELDALNALLQETGVVTGVPPCPNLGDLVTTDDQQQRPWADMNCSGTPNFDDTVLILRFVADLPADTSACPQIGSVAQLQP